MAKSDIREKESRNYRLTLVDGVSHRRLWSVGFTRLGFVILVLSVIVVFFIGSFCITAFTPLRSFIPGYPDEHTRKAAVENAVRIDSLERQILQWELYSENLKRVAAGEEPLHLDSLIVSHSTGEEQ